MRLCFIGASVRLMAFGQGMPEQAITCYARQVKNR
jgi:hypothetical protein